MILVDTSEPESIVKLIEQVVPVTVMDLNRQHMSDYYFSNYEGKRFQFSRKQAGELLGNLDEAEDQLRDYYEQADCNFQIVEGIISPVEIYSPGGSPLVTRIPGPIRDRGSEWQELREAIIAERGRYCQDCGRVVLKPNPLILHHNNKVTTDDSLSNLTLLCFDCHDRRHYPNMKESKKAPAVEITTRDLGAHIFAYKMEPSGFIGHGYSFTANSSMLYAWRHRLAMCGIVTYETATWVETARLLTTIFRNEQKPPEAHSTLKRIIVPRMQIKEQDPLVKALMFLSAAYKLGVGEKTATAIAAQFCNILDIATSPISELMKVEGVGKITATKLLIALGRDKED